MIDFLSIALQFRKDYLSEEQKNKVRIQDNRRLKKEQAEAAAVFLRTNVTPALEAASIALGHTHVSSKITRSLDTEDASLQKSSVSFKCFQSNRDGGPAVETPSMFFECDGIVMTVGLGEAAYDARPKIHLGEVRLDADATAINEKIENLLREGIETLLRELYNLLSKNWPRE